MDAPASLPPDWKLRRQIRMNHLLLLQALDEHGSLRRAAESLSVTQPAATKLLAQLESLLGLALFERGSRGLTPTEYGRIMIRHAQAALGEISAARESLALSALGAQGKVAIGAVVGSIPSLTGPAVADLLGRHPRVAISVLAETSATLVPMLLRGELDFVVGQIPPGVDADRLEFEVLGPEPIDVVARPGHPLASVRRLTLRRLADLPWILPPPGSPLRIRIDSAFRAAGLDAPRRVVESASTLLAVTVARETDMLAALSRDVARHYAASGFVEVLPFRMRDDAGTLGIVSRRRARSTAAAALLVDALRARARRAPAAFGR
ncbi:LysR family transcriptional regulator [Burkholderiaceae bacterium FT117]|uniref:LysR family transcriptional regulator n=1 Tax=Zeimonas sediminis TaxID=2944268 RepID=UPI002343090D|nr:LysR family transcriptional regulator [Zeimonas sediminis]MCM5569699.1 LysR family transcriptional regulator [Zeimonas sediminis]